MTAMLTFDKVELYYDQIYALKGVSITLEEGVSRMMAVIDDWRDAPLWNQSTIAEATADWFKHLGHTS